MEHWKQFAFALKARYLLHISMKNPDHLAEILTIITNHSFKSLQDQANFDWGILPGIENPLYTFGNYRPHTMLMDTSFMNPLLANDDPRLAYYASFQDGGWQFYLENNPDLYWTQQNSVIPIFSYVELKFIEAEVLLRTGANKEAIAGALYDGMEAGFVQMGMDPIEYDDYLTSHSNLDQLNSEDAILQHITYEAYFAYYGFGFIQVWTNFRRTGYPELNSTGESGEWNPSGSIPQRFLYPESERLYNATNVQQAIDRQDGALLDIPLWVFGN